VEREGEHISKRIVGRVDLIFETFARLIFSRFSDGSVRHGFWPISRLVGECGRCKRQEQSDGAADEQTWSSG
jgi:hypothetical protein